MNLGMILSYRSFAQYAAAPLKYYDITYNICCLTAASTFRTRALTNRTCVSTIQSTGIGYTGMVMRSRYRFLCMFTHGTGQKSDRNLTEVFFFFCSYLVDTALTKGGTGVSSCVLTKDNGRVRVRSCVCGNG